MAAWPTAPVLTVTIPTCDRRRHGLILRHSTPELYGRWLRETTETSMSGPTGEPLVPHAMAVESTVSGGALRG